jgi:hypothetical protein
LYKTGAQFGQPAVPAVADDKGDKYHEAKMLYGTYIGIIVVAALAFIIVTIYLAKSKGYFTNPWAAPEPKSWYNLSGWGGNKSKSSAAPSSQGIGSWVNSEPSKAASSRSKSKSGSEQSWSSWLTGGVL